MRLPTFALAVALLVGCGSQPEESAEAPEPETNADYLVYIGTGSSEPGQGIYVSKFDSSTGTLAEPELAAELKAPNFLEIHPSEEFLYTVSRDEEGGYVAAMAIEKPSGKLTMINKVSSKGEGPCHVNLDSRGRVCAIANYSSGSVASFLVKEDGGLSEATGFDQHKGKSVNPKRQEGPHAHSVNFSPDDRFLVAADLGMDKLLVYRVNYETGEISANDPAAAAVDPGAGPRHFTFHPSGKFAYVINEMASTVTAFSYDAEKGAFSSVQTISTLPEGFDGENTTAEVRVHPSGKFLYGSNRGHDSIAVFSIDGETGKLTPVEQEPTMGAIPRNFNLDPTGKWLLAANQDSGNVVVFAVDQATGELSATGGQVEAPRPMCIRFVKL